ncbi:3-hydroxyacyl-CoA dehydrogenase NAD-binding domain-containing protein [Pelagibacterium luteolum]|uniref:3-hydroxyacyl-CoA dehydrogenase n=1 Tax=Pelagibacterium luteolum TaxID=440168 RepID=A0A1G8AB16_9HYPH|nr:3-hydroxyacyl-CoA dehydrogenase NAD-binding domain-containing protein [Pelagibacterium luteolum]SDH18138.1 3-hydroxyacyl-CoA dehydrogenase [Pelagibacterium luteolum]
MLGFRGDVAVITIDNPPVNAGSAKVRAGLLEALGALGDRNGIKVAIIIGAGKTFMAGSDIREFGAPLSDPQLPAVIAAIEACPVPVIAAIHGAALGGGFELALGCDYRIAQPGARIGLPEVGLGLVPGAGGTQRLPRLVGMEAALELVVSAKRIDAQRGYDLGAIDALSDGDILDDALAFADTGLAKRPLHAMAIAPFEHAAVKSLSAKLIAKAKGRPAAEKAAHLTLQSLEHDLRDGLEIERAVFQDIRITPEAFAYRYQFFAERQASKNPFDAQAKTIAAVAVVGLGTMGAGIAYCFLRAGYKVIGIEGDQDLLDTGLGRIDALIEKDIAASRITPEAAQSMRENLLGNASIEAAKDADLALEAIFEDLAVKRDLLGRLSAVLSPDALIATNTSYLDIDAMAEAVSHPERFFGLHFFSPAHIMSLLEIVSSTSSSAGAIASGFAIARKLGKQPVFARNSYGFIGNRIYAAYRRQAEFLLEDGAEPPEIDAAMIGFGMALGPFAVSDLSGLDIAWRMRQAQAASRDPKARYVRIADQLCEAGRLGRKTGAGFYDYPNGKPVASPIVTEIIDAERRARAITPRTIGSHEIQARCFGAMVNEAVLLLEEGVALRGSDIDVVLVHGYGFPRWLGGPMWHAAHMEPAALDSAIDLAAQAEGVTFRRGDAATALATLKNQN